MNQRQATETQNLDYALETFPDTLDLTRRKLDRWRSVVSMPASAEVLDIGAAQGVFVAACGRLGHRCVGLEPNEHAFHTAKLLSERLEVSISMVRGRAEDLPFEDERFDVVHAHSVIEHVEGLDAALSEIFRVLKPGGIFWFNAASAMCPFQEEIDGFPLFGWYPDALKRRIMFWARDHRPQLIGGTEWPAVNWFTPARARKLLRSHGFGEVVDRWDLRRSDEGGRIHRWALPVIRSSRTTKTIADVVIAGCSYAGIKTSRKTGEHQAD